METGNEKLETQLLIIIVNYKTPGLAIDALRSLAAEIPALPPTTVEILDNGSADGSAEKISQAIAQNNWSNWCHFTALEKNLGFAAANNLPLRNASLSNQGSENREENVRVPHSPDPATPHSLNPSIPQSPHPSFPSFVLLLNPDTLVRPGAIQTLITFLQQNPAAGIAGSRLEDPDGSAQRSAFRFPNFLTELNDTLRMKFLPRLFPRAEMGPPVRDDAHRTDWVAGASMLIRRAVFEKIGLLDEGFFVYFEEVDFCYRAHRAGFQTWYVPQSRVVHLVGQASNVNTRDVALPRRPRYWFDARRRFYRKNYGLLHTLAANLAFTLGLIAYRLRRLVIHKPIPDPPYFLRDFIRYSYF